MSMNCYVLRLSQFEVASMRRNPASASRVAQSAAFGGAIPRAGRSPGTPNLLLNIGLLREGGGTGVLVSPFLRRELERQMEQANAVAATAREIDPSRLLDLHKSWHALHYLFTGQSDGGVPPANALLGGRELGQDMGYGPARLHEPAATAAFARFLGPLTVEELTGRIDLGRMQRLGIYCCDDADEGGLEELTGDVEHYFPQLKGFVAEAANRGDGMLVWLS
jgi:hypothetical protein